MFVVEPFLDVRLLVALFAYMSRRFLRNSSTPLIFFSKWLLELSKFSCYSVECYIRGVLLSLSWQLG